MSAYVRKDVLAASIEAINRSFGQRFGQRDVIEGGKVFLPSGAARPDDYIDELATFPHGAHDDAVDSTTMALNDLRTRGLEPGIITYYRRCLEAQGIKVPDLPPISAA